MAQRVTEGKHERTVSVRLACSDLRVVSERLALDEFVDVSKLGRAFDHLRCRIGAPVDDIFTNSRAK